MVHGFTDRRRRERQARAWALGYQLIAAGCKPEEVTVAKLLGEHEDDEDDAPTEQLPVDKIFEMMPRVESPAKESHGGSNG